MFQNAPFQAKISKKMLSPGVIFELKIIDQNGQLGDLTTLPRPLAGFHGAAWWQRRGGHGRGQFNPDYINNLCLRFNGHFPGEPGLAGVY